MLGLTRAFLEPHHGGATGSCVNLHRPGTPLFVGLATHEANQGERFDEARTGLDHVAFHVADRAGLDAWVDHFDRLGVRDAGVAELRGPVPFAVLGCWGPNTFQSALTTS